MKQFKLLLLTSMLGFMLAAIYLQYRSSLKQQEENHSLRQRVEELTALNDELSRQAVSKTSNSVADADDRFRELMKLRGEVTVLRRQQDDFPKQLAIKAAPPPVQPATADKAWVDDILNGTLNRQGTAAGTL